jgi:protein-disulfide isomerase
MVLNKKNLFDGSTILGNPNAKISIVEFGDYQCTFCYKFHDDTMKIIVEQYVAEGKVNFVYKDFPLNGPASIMASEASYCAQEQGKFWQYHDLIYENWEGENTGWLTKDALQRFAGGAELNLNEFNSCMNDSKYRQKVLDNEEFARKNNIDATPSFIIFDDTNAYRIIGAQPFEKFEQVLKELG